MKDKKLWMQDIEAMSIMNKKIQELYNITENKDKIINEQVIKMIDLQQENKKLKEQLIKIKEYIEKEKDSNLVKEEYETPGYLKHDILEIVNEAFGGKNE